MTEYPDLRHILAIHDAIPNKEDGVRDIGAVEAACMRPQATAFGDDAYPTIWAKAAALMQSLACNHGFVDGNKRVAWIATMSFLGDNDHPQDEWFDVDDAEEFVLNVATGALRDVPAIANALVKFTVR